MHVERSSPLILYPTLSASNRNFSYRALQCWKWHFDTLIDQESSKDERASIKGSVSLAGIAERVFLQDAPDDCHVLLALEGAVFGLLAGEKSTTVLKIHALVFKSGSTLKGHLSSLSQAMPVIEAWAVRRGILEIHVKTPAVFVPSYECSGFHSPEPIQGALDLTLLKKEVPPALDLPEIPREEVALYRESLKY